MDTATQRALIALNNQFYKEHASSFSATRHSPWKGWERVVDALSAQVKPTSNNSNNPHEPLVIVDLACGNLRFEHFAAKRLAPAALTFHAIDACEELADTCDAKGSFAREGSMRGVLAHRMDSIEPEPGGNPNASITFHQHDILDALMGQGEGHPGTAGAHWDDLGSIPPADLTACFGFMHHVPGCELRRSVLSELIRLTAPNGLIAVSFWQFMDDARLARKALSCIVRNTAIDPSQLDENDHFLGWQDDPRPLRYCHHTPEREIDELVASVGTHVRELARYSADGASGTLNRYLILQRTP